MGGSNSTEQPPPTEFVESWRKLHWGNTKDLEEKLSKFQLQNATVKHIRILIVGDVGVGKSSFINSVNSVFQHRITSAASFASAFGSNIFKDHYVKREDGSKLPFMFNVIEINLQEGTGPKPEDVISALKGHLKEGSKFNPKCALTENSKEYKNNPDLEDHCFCLVYVVDTNKVSDINQKFIKKLKTIREAALELEMPQVVIMTKPDEACPLVEEHLQKIYNSKKIKDKMQVCSNLLGIPMNTIFPVKNYHEEVDTNEDVDLLILKALDQIVHAANDALENTFRQLTAGKELTEPWRKVEWGENETKVLEDKLKKLPMFQNEVQYLRILVVGAVGVGKSSFINSVNNAFTHRITSGALVATGSGTSFTKDYETHYIEEEDGSRLHFIFNDIMGLESEDGRGANEHDIVKAIKGLIKEGYRFNPASALTENSPDYRDNPGLQDQTFCLVNVVDGSRVSLLNQKLIDKLRYIREAASELKLPQVLIMTKADETCPLVKKDLRKIYKSIKIKEQMQKCSNLSGIPMNHIFPVKNYHEEMDTNNDMDFLILKAMDQIVHIANDALKKKL